VVPESQSAHHNNAYQVASNDADASSSYDLVFDEEGDRDIDFGYGEDFDYDER
jgi:hypothetical protein